jgi:TonB family protein
VISGADRSALQLPLSMSVLVEVDETGKVTAVEPHSGTGDWGSPYAVAAITAARKWRFEPAREGEERIPGKIILRFRFEPNH